MKKHIVTLGLFVGCLLSSILNSHAGAALRLFYDGINGASVSNLTSAAIFPNAPTDRSPVVQYLEGSVGAGENFGSWIRGYLEAPQTGLYIFSVASDDNAQFWLSSDHTTNNCIKIAENIGF